MTATALAIASQASTPVLRVLVVEDDETLRRIVARALRRLGCDVEVEADTPSALLRVREGSYDLVLSDVELPCSTGLDLLRTVRAEKPELPVALMTGGDMPETVIEAVNGGAFSFLTKPFDEGRLARLIAKVANARQRTAREESALAALGRRDQEDEDLSHVLRSLWMAYQPIVDYSRRDVFGHEALLRARAPRLPSPVAIIEAAERHGAMRRLSRAIRRQVAASAGDHCGNIFVNLHASDLDDPDLYDPDSPLARMAPRVVLEITERSSLSSVPSPTSKVRALKDLGFRVALDDLGAGWAGLAYIAELEPNFVKLDRGLVQGLHAAPRHRSVVRAVLALCGQLGMSVIAEGVETKAERDALADEGCTLMQGYLFGRPSADVSIPSFGD